MEQDQELLGLVQPGLEQVVVVTEEVDQVTNLQVAVLQEEDVLLVVEVIEEEVEVVEEEVEVVVGVLGDQSILQNLLTKQ